MRMDIDMTSRSCAADSCGSRHCFAPAVRLHGGLLPKLVPCTLWNNMPCGKPTLLLQLGVLLLLLVGCGSHQSATLATPSAAPVPDYGVGDSYRFSDGSAENVVAIERDAVQWRDSDGTYVTAREVLLPRLAWTNASVHGERRITDARPLLFPLQPGKSVVFSASRTISPLKNGSPTTVLENWQCSVQGTARAETKAGSFDTWRVDCSMTEQSDGSGGSVAQRSFYYAPEIGFYVRREERVGAGQVQRIELTDYTTTGPSLPDSALSLRARRIQQTLEQQVSGEAASWGDPATGSAGDVRPLRTVWSSQHGWCRDFAESIHSSGRVYSVHGTGCRDLSGIWNIVSLTPTRNRSS
jgi:hypothetical protein